MSFVAPLGLLLGVLAAPLIALYFLKIRRRRVAVPSLLLWERFMKSEELSAPFQRFRKHFLLLLQLLVLLLIVLAFARPFLNGHFSSGRSVVIVMDTSASMAAVDESPNRLVAAQIRAAAVVDNLSPGDEVLLVEAGPQTRVVSSFSRDVSLVRDAISSLTPRAAEGALREGVQLALSLAGARPDVEILIFTDGGHQELADLNVTDVAMQMYVVGLERDNTGILAMDIRSSTSSELDRQLFVTAQNFGAETQSVSLQVFLNQKLIAHREVDLQPDVPEPFVFDLPAGQKGILRAVLAAENDYLPLDNEAFSVLEPLSKQSILVVDGDGLTLRALGADPRFNVSRATSEVVTPEAIATFDAVLFMGALPFVPKGVNYAVFGPSGNEGGVTWGNVVRQPEITRWSRTHPTQRFVQWDGVLIVEQKTVKQSGGLTAIVESDKGPLVLAGTVQQSRVLRLTFDPWKSDLPIRVAWPVFVLNTAGWLVGKESRREQLRSVTTGQPIVRRVSLHADGKEVQVTGPAGKISVQVVDGLARVQQTDTVGIYEIQGAGLNERIAANLFSPNESKIEPSRLILGEQGDGTRSASVAGRYEIWRWLLLVGLAFLCIEWWVWNRRRFI